MANKKKLLTSAIALGTAAAMLLGGTFAWQSISQTALNEASDIVNPGGRLHDDFDGSNKDVYVENFAEENIFARVRLEEYFEILMNYGVEGAEKSDVLLGSKEANTDEATMADQPYIYQYELYKFDGNENEDGTFQAAVKDGTSWWIWSVGNEESGEKYYMPTFNLNKDSMVADTNGDYVDAVGGISNRDGTQYENYVEYGDGTDERPTSKTDTEIYDGDANDIDEVGKDFANLADYADHIVTVENQTHDAKLLETTDGLISMEEYLALGQATGNYWVYDTDGWVYWANPIQPGETTGRLLDGIALSGVMDDTWYYAINVVAQFVTADDVGKEDGTGFYDTAKGSAPSAEAETLLKNIGVDLGEDGNVPDEGETQTLTLGTAETKAGLAFVAVKNGETVKLMSNGAAAEMADFTLEYATKSESILADGNYTFENGQVTFQTGSALSAGSVIKVTAGGNTGYILLEDDGELVLSRTQGTPYDGMVVTLNTPITVTTDDDHEEASIGELTVFGVGSETVSSTYENGQLTVTDADWDGYGALVSLLVSPRENDYNGMIFVKAAE